MNNNVELDKLIGILVIAFIIYCIVEAYTYSVHSSYPSNAVELYNFTHQVAGGMRCKKYVLWSHNGIVSEETVPVGKDTCYLADKNTYFGDPTIPEFASTTRLILGQFRDLISRLSKLYSSRETLLQKYGLEYVKQLDEDIRNLSSAGLHLASVTRQFLDQVKIIEAQKEVLAVRKDALSGLKTFTTEIDKVNQMVNSSGNEKSFEAVTAQIEKAVRELEKEIQK